MLRWITIRNGVHVAVSGSDAVYAVVEEGGSFEVTSHHHNGVLVQSEWLGTRDSVIEAGKLAQEDDDE